VSFDFVAQNYSEAAIRGCCALLFFKICPMKKVFATQKIVSPP